MLNSDFRGECIEPLNQMTAFLPPEMRDFNIILRDMDWRHMGPTLTTNVKRLILSEFNGGNQQVAAVPSLLSVPEFRIYTAVVRAGEAELFTPMGPPSFWAVYARSGESPNYGTQPLIVNMSMSCLTTGKKSDSIDDTGLAELYFMTHRKGALRAHRLQRAPGDPPAIRGRRHHGPGPGAVPAREDAVPGQGRHS